MNREDIIRMAREAGIEQDGDNFFSPLHEEIDVHITDLERFAALVAAAERESWPAEMEAMERQVNILTDALAQAKAEEREACARVCEERKIKYEQRAAEPEEFRDINPEVARIAAMTCDFNAAAIRARGQSK